MTNQIRLRDGATLTIRALTPSDRNQIERLIESLSDRSRHFRFASPTPRLQQRQIDELCNLDGHRQFAWGAFSNGDLVAMSRYVRYSFDNTLADVAVTVRDDLHGRGVGSRLLEALALQAAHDGIDRFSFHVLGENRKAIRLLQRFGGKFRYSSGLGEGELPTAAFDLGRLQPSRIAA
ncbi:MAG: GNAT family N-acetyltransferase [Acidobacteriota bacterium]|jgi:RimJ/RimL family protein N-acetyltransferase